MRGLVIFVKTSRQYRRLSTIKILPRFVNKQRFSVIPPNYLM